MKLPRQSPPVARVHVVPPRSVGRATICQQHAGECRDARELAEIQSHESMQGTRYVECHGNSSYQRHRVFMNSRAAVEKFNAGTCAECGEQVMLSPSRFIVCGCKNRLVGFDRGVAVPAARRIIPPNDEGIIYQDCPKCKGTGEITCRACEDNDEFDYDCPICNDELTCSRCKGEGLVAKEDSARPCHGQQSLPFNDRLASLDKPLHDRLTRLDDYVRRTLKKLDPKLRLSLTVDGEHGFFGVRSSGRPRVSSLLRVPFDHVRECESYLLEDWGCSIAKRLHSEVTARSGAASAWLDVAESAASLIQSVS